MRFRTNRSPADGADSMRTGAILMVMPRSRSSSIWSRYCGFMRRASTVFVASSSRSARVDFPWSMWAIITKLRIFCIAGQAYRTQLRSSNLLERKRRHHALRRVLGFVNVPRVVCLPPDVAGRRFKLVADALAHATLLLQDPREFSAVRERHRHGILVPRAERAGRPRFHGEPRPDRLLAALAFVRFKPDHIGIRAVAVLFVVDRSAYGLRRIARKRNQFDVRRDEKTQVVLVRRAVPAVARVRSGMGPLHRHVRLHHALNIDGASHGNLLPHVDVGLSAGDVPVHDGKIVAEERLGQVGCGARESVRQKEVLQREVTEVKRDVAMLEMRGDPQGQSALPRIIERAEAIENDRRGIAKDALRLPHTLRLPRLHLLLDLLKEVPGVERELVFRKLDGADKLEHRLDDVRVDRDRALEDDAALLVHF